MFAMEPAFLGSVKGSQSMRLRFVDHVIGRLRPPFLLILPVLFALTVLSLPGTLVHAQQQGILIAGASPTQPYALLRGCNQVVSDAPNGARLAGMVTLVTPADAVASIWRYNNATQKFQVGFFADPFAPTDFTAIGSGSLGRSTETYFVCVQKAAVIVGG
jgi:hypothetical protein